MCVFFMNTSEPECDCSYSLGCYMCVRAVWSTCVVRHESRVDAAAPPPPCTPAGEKWRSVHRKRGPPSEGTIEPSVFSAAP